MMVRYGIIKLIVENQNYSSRNTPYNLLIIDLFITISPLKRTFAISRGIAFPGGVDNNENGSLPQFDFKFYLTSDGALMHNQINN
ncbi:MAG: hypothetical protein SWZ49_11090 [Cyanobacteriota bacterium]|nr:hypothetical protein [Cyanobacteriota bacterium]